MSSDASQPAAVSERFPAWSRSGAGGKTLLLLAAVLCYALFHWTGVSLQIPTHAGYSVSLFQQNSPILAVLIIAILFFVGVSLGTLVAGVVHIDAGLFAAAWGLVALRLRGGPMQYILIRADGREVFLQLAIEAALLLAILLIGWQVIQQVLARSGWISRELLPDAHEEEEGINQRVLACVGQIIVMILALLVLAQTDAKFQVIAAVGISAWAGTVGSYVLFPTRPGVWYCVGPMIVAIIGYLFAYFGDEGLWIVGQASPSLARATPLDYAGAGTIGSLIGYWMSRRWQQRREEESTATGKEPKTA